MYDSKCLNYRVGKRMLTHAESNMKRKVTHLYNMTIENINGKLEVHIIDICVFRFIPNQPINYLFRALIHLYCRSNQLKSIETYLENVWGFSRRRKKMKMKMKDTTNINAIKKVSNRWLDCLLVS